MILINNDNMALMNYLVKFNDNNITESSRNKVIEIVNDFDSYLTIFNEMVYICKLQIKNEIVTLQSICEKLKTEYQLLGFDKYINYRYLEDVIILSFNIVAPINVLNPEMIFEKILHTIEELKNCKDNQLVHDLYYFMITIINSYSVAVFDIDTTRQILDKIESFHDEEIELKLLPEYLIGF